MTNYFKSLAATAALIVGCWSPAAAQVFNLSEVKLHCFPNDPVFLILNGNEAYLGFHQNGNVAFRPKDTRTDTYGVWRRIENTDDVTVVIRDYTFIVTDVFTTQCDTVD